MDGARYKERHAKSQTWNRPVAPATLGLVALRVCTVKSMSTPVVLTGTPANKQLVEQTTKRGREHSKRTGQRDSDGSGGGGAGSGAGQRRGSSHAHRVASAAVRHQEASRQHLKEQESE